MSYDIWLSPPHMGGSEEKYIKEALDQNWVAPAGPHIKEFEDRLCEYSGAANAVALNSGTAALHLALMLLNVGPGDEVICPTFTFVATINPIIYTGASPVFVDSEEKSWNMSPEILEEAIIDRIKKGKKPKAILIAHIYGVPADMDHIIDISKKYDIPVIEDAAESVGSTYRGKMTGTFGDIGIYSFNGNKIITTSGGGALVTDNKYLAEKALFLATQAKDRQEPYLHKNVGYNYRMSNIAAAIGLGQLDVIKDRVNKRREIFNWYKEEFSSLDCIQFIDEEDKASSNRWLTNILLRGDMLPEKLREILQEQRIESRLLWMPMHKQPIFSHCSYYGSNLSTTLFDKGLSLPSGSALKRKDVGAVSEVVKKYLSAF